MSARGKFKDLTLSNPGIVVNLEVSTIILLPQSKSEWWKFGLQIIHFFLSVSFFRITTHENEQAWKWLKD